MHREALWIIFMLSAVCALVVCHIARDVWQALMKTVQNLLADLTCNCCEVTALRRALWESLNSSILQGVNLR